MCSCHGYNVTVHHLRMKCSEARIVKQEKKKKRKKRKVGSRKSIDDWSTMELLWASLFLLLFYSINRTITRNIPASNDWSYFRFCRARIRRGLCSFGDEYIAGKWIMRKRKEKKETISIRLSDLDEFVLDKFCRIYKKIVVTIFRWFNQRREDA